MFPLVYMISSV